MIFSLQNFFKTSIRQKLISIAACLELLAIEDLQRISFKELKT
jgi:hypothetical protein